MNGTQLDETARTYWLRPLPHAVLCELTNAFVRFLSPILCLPALFLGLLCQEKDCATSPVFLLRVPSSGWGALPIQAVPFDDPIRASLEAFRPPPLQLQDVIPAQPPIDDRLVGTDRYFSKILWDSMRFYAHAPRRLQKILNVQSFRVICQLFLEGSTLLICI